MRSPSTVCLPAPPKSPTAHGNLDCGGPGNPPRISTGGYCCFTPCAIANPRRLRAVYLDHDTRHSPPSQPDAPQGRRRTCVDADARCSRLATTTTHGYRESGIRHCHPGMRPLLSCWWRRRSMERGAISTSPVHHPHTCGPGEGARAVLFGGPDKIARCALPHRRRRLSFCPPSFPSRRLGPGDRWRGPDRRGEPGRVSIMAQPPAGRTCRRTISGGPVAAQPQGLVRTILPGHFPPCRPLGISPIPQGVPLGDICR